MLIEYLDIVSRLRTNLAANKSKMKYNTHTVQYIVTSYSYHKNARARAQCSCYIYILYARIQYIAHFVVSLSLSFNVDPFLFQNCLILTS